MNTPSLPGCVVMAAGSAERFGSNKLLRSFRGEPLILRTLRAIPRELFSRVAVVTGCAEIKSMAQRMDFEVIENVCPEAGVSRTIRLGTEALAECPGILYLVGDQPLLTQETIRRVVSLWRENPGCIAAPQAEGRSGNPCLFSSRFYPALCALTGDVGGKAVIRRHADALVLVEVPARELADCDTEEALSALC